MALLDLFVLYGDSLTQASFSQNHTNTSSNFAFGAALADAYARKLDVLNRGLSGFNSTQAYLSLPLCLPEPEIAKMRFLTIFFGANDARIAGSPGGPDQSVEVEEFKTNIRGMVGSAGVKSHVGCRVILITPPPVDERLCSRFDREKYPSLPRGVLRRTAARTSMYAQAVREVGLELGVPVCDVWTAMTTRAGYSRHQTLLPGSMEAPENETLQGFLSDGLHLTGEGQGLVFGELMGLIEREWPDQMPARLGMRVPAWDAEGVWKAKAKDGEGDIGREGRGNMADGVGQGEMLVEGRFEAVVQRVS